jgi:hypothetical protein
MRHGTNPLAREGAGSFRVCVPDIDHRLTTRDEPRQCQPQSHSSQLYTDCGALDYRPHTILIERAGPGLHLIQEFQANPVNGVAMPIGISPEGDKVGRMAAQSTRFESSQVYLPREAPWLSEFVREILGFPHTRHDDQIDSVSQFLNWIESSHRWEPTVSVVDQV